MFAPARPFWKFSFFPPRSARHHLMRPLSDDTFFARFLVRLAQVVYRRRKLFFYPQIALFGVCVFYTVEFLKFDTSRNNLVGSDKKYHQNFLTFKKEFPTQDDLVVVVESEDPEKNRQFVERLGPRLEAARIRAPVRPGSKEMCETNLFTDVFYKGDLKMMGAKALLFVPETDLVELKKTLHDYRPFIREFAQTTNLVSLFDMVNTQFRTAKREKSAETDSLVKAFPALERIVDQARGSLVRAGTPPSPGINMLFGATDEAEQQIYITFSRGQIYLVTAHAPRDDLNGEAVERLRALVEEIKSEVPGLNVGLTGEPVLEHDEMAQSQQDSTVASIASLIICALIFIYGYQQTGRPIKATLCLIVGLGYTLAFATLVVGHLNILTITFVPILIGLAIDFGVHLITRYEEELRHGRTEEQALTKAMVFTGQGIFSGAFTTAGAFLAMALTNFKGIQEMGVICGGGLLICLIPMMTLLPVMLLRGRQNVIDHEQANQPDRRARIERLWLDRPVFVTIVTILLCALALTQFHKVYFDYNLLHMQSEGLPAVEFERKLLNATARPTTNSSSRSVLFGAVIANSPEEAIELEARIRKLPAVAEVDSIARFLGEDQSAKLKIIAEIKEELSSLEFGEPDARPVNIPELSRTLYSFYGYLGAAFQEVQREEPALSKQFVSLRQSVEALRKEMLRGAPATTESKAARLAAFQRALFEDVRETFHSMKNQDNSAPLQVKDLPPALRNRFVGVTGKYLLQVYPKNDVWERKNQKEFIRELRQALDPKRTDRPIITGTPIQLYEYTNLLKKSYEEAALYALGAIVILVLIHFRSLLSVVLALLPVAVGSIWLGGFMGLRDIPFNPANIMTLPLVIGIGVTNGIHILNRFAEERKPGILAKSTGKAVLVSGLTTIAGFGSLILAKHQGIESLGYVMSAGVALCMIAGLTFLPAVLNLLNRRGHLIEQPSADNARSTLGREEPRLKNLKSPRR
jgi:hypothetical protein